VRFAEWRERQVAGGEDVNGDEIGAARCEDGERTMKGTRRYGVEQELAEATENQRLIGIIKKRRWLR
jgi:hypothetical protein